MRAAVRPNQIVATMDTVVLISGTTQQAVMMSKQIPVIKRPESKAMPYMHRVLKSSLHFSTT